MDETHETANECGKIKAKDFGVFYPSFSAYTEKPMSLAITSATFNSKSEQKGLDFWTNETSHHAPEIFKKIHYLRAFAGEKDHHLVNTDVTDPKEWADGSKSSLKSINEMQETTLNALINGEAQLDLSSGELEMIVEYLNDHHHVSKTHYKGLISGITKYLTKSSKEYTMMSYHITDLTKKIESANLASHMTKTEKLVGNMKNQFETIEKKMSSMSVDTNEVHKNLSAARKVIGQYVDHIQKAAPNAKNTLKKNKASKKTMGKVVSNTVWFMAAVL